MARDHKKRHSTKKTGSGSASNLEVELFTGVAGMVIDKGFEKGKKALENFTSGKKERRAESKPTNLYWSERERLWYRIGSDGRRRYDVSQSGWSSSLIEGSPLAGNFLRPTIHWIPHDLFHFSTELTRFPPLIEEASTHYLCFLLFYSNDTTPFIKKSTL